MGKINTRRELCGACRRGCAAGPSHIKSCYRYQNPFGIESTPAEDDSDVGALGATPGVHETPKVGLCCCPERAHQTNLQHTEEEINSAVARGRCVDCGRDLLGYTAFDNISVRDAYRHERALQRSGLAAILCQSCVWYRWDNRHLECLSAREHLSALKRDYYGSHSEELRVLRRAADGNTEEWGHDDFHQKLARAS